MIVDDIATENEFDYWLIAAAPEMLEFLKLLDRQGGLGFAKHDRIQAIIAKAEGRAPTSPKEKTD